MAFNELENQWSLNNQMVNKFEKLLAAEQSKSQNAALLEENIKLLKQQLSEKANQLAIYEENNSKTNSVIENMKQNMENQLRQIEIQNKT